VVMKMKKGYPLSGGGGIPFVGNKAKPPIIINSASPIGTYPIFENAWITGRPIRPRVYVYLGFGAGPISPAYDSSSYVERFRKDDVTILVTDTGGGFSLPNSSLFSTVTVGKYTSAGYYDGITKIHNTIPSDNYSYGAIPVGSVPGPGQTFLMPTV